MDATISAPQDRYSFFAAGNFDVTDRVRANARATFAESDTETRLFGTSVVFGWETGHPVQPDDGQSRESDAELQGSRRRPGRS